MRQVSRAASAVMAGLVAAALFATPTSTQAAEFDALGRLVLDGAALTYSFDGPPAATLLEPVIFDAEFNRLPASDEDFILNDKGLEGAGAMRYGGDRGISYWLLGEQWSRFEGRRVQARLWFKAEQTDVVARLSWLSGDGRAYLAGEQVPLMPMGGISLQPTGRATSDGWVELESPPFDYLMAGLAPTWLSIVDTQHTKQSGWQGYPYDPQARVLLDALEVVDLGPARTPSLPCNGATERSACGEGGACLMGQCVDGAALWGTAPRGRVGQDYIARRLFELEAFAGPRYGRSQLGEVAARLLALDPDQVAEYWKGFAAAFELLIDGHGSPPSNSDFALYHDSGICLGPGVADLLPAREPGELLPMIFSADSSFADASALRQGDVLTTIDGLDVWEWVSLHPELFSYNGDPAGREAMATLLIVKAAKRLGATLQFERCARQDGQVCAAAEVETIAVNFAQSLGTPIWEGSLPADLYEQSVPCDMRFVRPVPMNISAFAFYNFADWQQDSQGIRSLLINGVPADQGRGGRRWHTSVSEALTGQPARVLLDQRTGYGGTFDGVARVIGNLLPSQNKAYTMLVPWIGEEIEGGLLDTFLGCVSSRANEVHGCGSFLAISPTDLVNTGGATTSRVAVLNGYDVSGNDYLSRFLAYRTQAPTRIFGYAPIIGAYGASCGFSPMLWEARSMAYQCHDSKFAASPMGPFGEFESGTGVAPDVIVYQSQRDAVQGVDSMLEAARAWLLEDDQSGDQP